MSGEVQSAPLPWWNPLHLATTGNIARWRGRIWVWSGGPAWATREPGVDTGWTEVRHVGGPGPDWSDCNDCRPYEPGELGEHRIEGHHCPDHQPVIAAARAEVDEIDRETGLASIHGWQPLERP